MATTQHPLTDEQIAEFWPDADPADIRRQFDALMSQMGLVWHRSFPKHHELFATISAEKARELPERVAMLTAALAGLPEHWRQWQWMADAKPVFGERYVRSVYGDNGHGMGRQAIAVVPADKHYFGTLADFIAAANPDTIGMLIAAYQGAAPSAAARDVLAERRRQVEVEGFDAAHDDAEHDSGEFAGAASAYALNAACVLHPFNGTPLEGPPESWLFEPSWWKTRSPREDLVRAAALIIAEIEKLDREAARS